MQDIHWASGHMGYFQSYTLGNLYGGMLLEAMEQDIPQWEQQMAKGEFSAINGWLHEHVHQYGMAIPPQQLLRQVTGKDLTEEPFLHYLRRRYLTKLR